METAFRVWEIAQLRLESAAGEADAEVEAILILDNV
jgi:hypothetical protein